MRNLFNSAISKYKIYWLAVIKRFYNVWTNIYNNIFHLIGDSFLN